MTSLTNLLDLDDLWERPAPSRWIIRAPLVGWLSGADIVVGLSYVPLVLGMLWVMDGLSRVGSAPWGWRWVVIVTMVLVLCLRRRFPLTVGCLAAAHLLLGGLVAPQVVTSYVTQVFYFVCFHATVAWGRSRRAAWGVMCAVTIFFLGWVAVVFSRANAVMGVLRAMNPEASADVAGYTRVIVLQVVINLAFVVGAGAMGQIAWRGARDLARTRAQSATIAAQDRRLTDQAVVSERLRLAREIHDSVAHHVSVIGIQAAGARRAMGVAPDLARGALASVEEESRLAVGEMHSLLGSLRAGDAASGGGDGSERSGEPGLKDLEDLCGRPHRASVTLDVIGDPENVPDTMGLTVYRIVQEALTNVDKHSGASRAHVAVRIGVTRVEIEVTDSGHGTQAVPGHGGTGVGLIGMRERVAAHQGSLDVGPRATSGWRVLARLPLPHGSDDARGDEQP